ncbi:MAG: hypothetical protein HW413_433 [Thermoleophilia bacterium]|nr:hypothetical protein [Thermoleophilia bacterium]
MAEKRGLTPTGVPGAEDVGPEELEERDAHRDGGPQYEASKDDRQILHAAHEERYRKRKEGVLAELEEAHEMVVEQRVVERRRPERRESEPRQQCDRGNPEEPGRSKARRARPNRAAATTAATTTTSTAASESRTSMEVEPRSTLSSGW